jgi:hypothetical protein
MCSLIVSHDRYDQYHDCGHDQYDRMEDDDYQYERATSETRERERTRDVEHEYRRSERSLTGYPGLPNAFFKTSWVSFNQISRVLFGATSFRKDVKFLSVLTKLYVIRFYD